MIPRPGCDPNINVFVIGASILNALREEQLLIDDILRRFSFALSVSVDHVILSMDWLYMIGAIKIESEVVKLNAPSVS